MLLFSLRWRTTHINSTTTCSPYMTRLRSRNGYPGSWRDTLDSRALLTANGKALLAAILHGLPRAAARLEPKLAAGEPAVAALLDGQRAANQVWALHAERSGQGNPEGLRRLLDRKSVV